MKLQKKVLVIDDETDLCLLIKNFLTRKDCEVYLSHTLQEGLELVDTVLPDILFLDNNLPDGLGWEQASLLMEKHPAMKINLISAYHPLLPDIKITPTVKVWEKPISLRDLDRYLTDES